MTDMKTVTTTCPFCLETSPHEVPVEDSTNYCKADTASGICQREVDDPLARCWQHSDDESDE